MQAGTLEFSSQFVHLWESHCYCFSLEVVKGCKYYELSLSEVCSKTIVMLNLHGLMFDLFRSYCYREQQSVDVIGNINHFLNCYYF